MAERLVRHPLEVERLRLGADLGLSQRRLHGWEPRQFHHGYDLDGNRVPLAEAWEIVVETEPEWDDEERTRALGLRQYERGICECGFPASLTGDRSNHFAIEERRCPVCASSERYARMLNDQDERHKKQRGEKVPPAAPMPADGRQISLRLMAPDEVTRLQSRRRGGGDSGHKD